MTGRTLSLSMVSYVCRLVLIMALWKPALTEILLPEDIRLPTLEVTPIAPKEEDDLVFSCSVPISLTFEDAFKESLESLEEIEVWLYSFKKNGRQVRNFSQSNQYHISLAQLEDSGKYTCEIKFSSLHLESEVLKIQIKTDLESCPDEDDDDNDENYEDSGNTSAFGDDEDFGYWTFLS
ncbi:uncharacterized protein LOC143770408 [Ranitomeya variabilis]|uniref:uncharacterized protein LOC143770408 n=1 Tax=Ranitomeya variabilis TaxID=490064 RepID=UPI0040571B1B